MRSKVKPAYEVRCEAAAPDKSSPCANCLHAHDRAETSAREVSASDVDLRAKRVCLRGVDSLQLYY